MLRVFCDFDGTITDRDTIVFLTERFGAGAEFRREILDLIVAGQISVFEAIRRELETVKVSWEEAMDALKTEIRVDPGFGPLVRWCRLGGHRLSVVSSGMEPVVRFFVGPFQVPIFAHPVHPSSEGWMYSRDPKCDKVELVAEETSDAVVFIGDGTSDVDVIPHVDHLFAKEGRYLERFCRERRLPCTSFSGLDEVLEALRRLERQPASGCP